MSYRKTLFEMKKGKQMHASGTWKTTKKEDLIIKATGLFFSVSVIAVLVSAFLHIEAILIPSILCLALSFAGMFIVLFGLVYLKSRKEPMEKQYYSVDYKYDGIKEESEDNGHEISQEEFYGKKDDE